MRVDVSLVMKYYRTSPKFAGETTYWIGDKNAIDLRYPTNKVIESLWLKCVPASGPLVVKYRSSCALIVAIPVGVRKNRREKFFKQLCLKIKPATSR